MSIEKLEVVRKELEKKFPDFPADFCPNASTVLKEKFGLIRYQGFYWPNGVNNGIGIIHHWPCDEKRNIWEIAADYLDPSVPKVEIITPKNPRYKRYDFRWCLDPD